MIFATAMCALAVGCVGQNGGSPAAPGPAQRPLVTVDELVAAPEPYVGQRLRVRGQVHVLENHSRRPCTAADARDCGPEVLSVDLQLVTPGRPAGSAATLPLFRAAGNGKYEAVPCARGEAGGYVCGALVHGAVVTVEATLIKRVVTTGSVVEADGTVIPLQQAPAFLLVLD